MVSRIEEKTVSQKMDKFANKCRQAGLKVTPQRLAIYKSLILTDVHPSAEMVCKDVRRSYPNISLDTVNRTLLTLNEIGAAFVVEGSGDVRRYDANFDNHQHFKCIRCKRIIDFNHEPFDEVELPEHIGKQFQVLRRTVYFEGYCDNCRS